MSKFLGSIGLLILSCAGAYAQTMSQSGLVVSACGTVPSGFFSPYRATQDTTGSLCQISTCSVSPPVTYSVGQPFPVLIDASGRLCTN